MEGRSILIIGNFLSHVFGTRGICEQLSSQLDTANWNVVTASNKVNRFHRMADMIWVALRNRQDYQIAQIDVYSGWGFIWAEVICSVLGLLNKPYAITLHGGNLPVFFERWPRRVGRLLLRATVVTTPSAYVKQCFSGIRDDVILLRNAIDLSSYSFVARTNTKPKLAWLRAFHNIYSPSTAADALSLLANEYPDMELTMFGPDKGDGSLQVMRETAQRQGISNRIQTPGAIPKSEIPQRLASFDIFLNTTTVESFGVAVMEAAALGMCIVTTDVGELPYIWTHEHDALLVPPNNPEAMADAIRRILTEPGLAERLSRNARAKAEQFDWSIILPQWESLLLDVIEEHKHKHGK